MKVEAHAKINLTLEVLGVRSDGYHDLKSIVAPVPLHDVIELDLADDITVDMPGGLPQEKNLAWKAAWVLKRATQCTKGVRIVIEKRIPSGAGLGGGSADAAAVLNALNELWGLDLPKVRLCELAAEVGSDVPALTLGGVVLMEGRGERVTPLEESEFRDYPLPDMSRLVLRTPDVFVSTPEVFRAFDESDRAQGANDLQPAACRLHPEITQAIETLKKEGCVGVMMSGSGSSVFGFRPCKPELLAPAGDMTCLQAALDAGADAVYLGLDGFNMRSRSGVNFTCETLPEASARCRSRGVKLYLTLNSIVFQGELKSVEEVIIFAKPYVDAFIVADWGVVALCKKHGAVFHVSTQMCCSNSAAAIYMREQGATRVVLARECTLDEVSEIVRTSGVEIEAFVHGAQCIAESGRCFLSHDAYGCSANRGACHQPCRRRFLIKAIDRYTDKDGKPVHDAEAEFEVTPHTVLSAKDLCSIPFIDKLVKSGIASFKIEGRARKAEYVHAVVRAYRAAIDAAVDGTWTDELAAKLVADTQTVFHRESTVGMFYGRPGVEQFTDLEDSRATHIKRYAGVVLDYFLKAGIVHVQVQDHSISMGDIVQVHGTKTGVAEVKIESLRRDDEVLESATRGTWVTFPCPRVRVGDKVFVMERK